MLQKPDDDEEVDSESVCDSIAPDGSALLFGSSHSHPNLRVLHPEVVQIFRLWQTFLDNVNPLSKIVHAPTVQKQILEATTNLDEIPKGLQALMFAIYAMAVVSLSNAQCESIMGESKSTLLRKYQNGAQQALIKASFLNSSDMLSLQAYTLFLVGRPYLPHVR